MTDKKLHILFLCSWYPHPDDPSNGIFIRRHAKALALHHDVTVVFTRSSDKVTEPEVFLDIQDGNLKEYGIYYPKTKTVFPGTGAFLKFKTFKQQYQKAIDNVCQGKQIDVIHVNVIFPAAIPALYAVKKFPAAKLFITEHWSGYYPEDGNYKGFYVKKLSRQLVEKARAVFVISDKLKESMQSHQLVSNYELINNVVDTTVFKPNGIAKKHNGVLKLLHVSSLVEREKNISGIIEVVNALREKKHHVMLTIVGHNKQELPLIQQLVKRKGLEDVVIFEGYKQPAEIARLMNESDLFLLFSYFEGMPVVVLEALACGLPVISTPVGQIKKMVLPGMGIVLNSANVNECVEKILSFNRGKFADENSLFIAIEQHYSPEIICQTLTRYYHKYS